MKNAITYRSVAVSGLLLITTVTLLGACSTQQSRGMMTDERAQIALETGVSDRAEAYRLDGGLVDGLRFPDLTPGSHELRVRHHFEMPGPGGSGKLTADPQWERCIIGVRYDDFAAGEKYVFEIERRGFHSFGWLRSEGGEKLADAKVIRCGPAV